MQSAGVKQWSSNQPVPAAAKCHNRGGRGGAMHQYAEREAVFSVWPEGRSCVAEGEAVFSVWPEVERLKLQPN